MTINEIVSALAVVLSVGTNVALYVHLSARMEARFERMESRMEARFEASDRRAEARNQDLKDTWRAELHRVEEVLDARLKHLEERG